jgi:hypothetical protein
MTDAELVEKLRAIVAEWRRGCSNVRQVVLDPRLGVLFADHPEGCAECTAAAMRAVARLVPK